MGKLKLLFLCDLDNTLLHGQKEKKPGDYCVEIYKGSEQSFITPKVYCLLEKFYKREDIMLIAVTTRSVEQYMRINLGNQRRFKYALAGNGGVLIDKNGELDKNWYKKSCSFVKKYEDELHDLEKKYIMKNIYKNVYMVENLFLFIGCNDEQQAVQAKNEIEKDTDLDVLLSGRKIYIFPPKLNKGEAVIRAREKFPAKTVISAGDSLIDLPMFNLADISLADNEKLASLADKNAKIFIKNANERFGDFIANFLEDY